MEFNPQVYLNLFLFCLIPIGGSIIFYLLIRFTKFGKIKSWQRQLIIGIVFGGFAIISTEFGVSVGGGAATANVRDAAPLCAGLIFGGPAGAIAGVIGGVERFFAAYWGKGDYSQIACSVSTILAGFYAWGLRKFMFDNKRPSWGFALVIGIIMEVVHLTIIFLTHIDDSAKAFEVVRLISIPMIFANSFALFASCLIINIIDRKKESLFADYKKLTNKIQIWMLISVVVAFVAATAFVFVVQTNNSYNTASSLLFKGIDDVSSDVSAKSDEALLTTTQLVLNSYENQQKAGTLKPDLSKLCSVFQVSEISVFDRVVDSTFASGYATKITESSNPKYVEWTIHDLDTQAKEFEILLFKNPPQKIERGATTLVQAYMAPSQPNPKTPKMKYAGIAFTDVDVDPANRRDGFIQVGYDANLFQSKINDEVKDISKYRHIGENGLVIIADESGKIVSASSLDQMSLIQIGVDVTGKKERNVYETSLTDLNGNKIDSFFTFEQKEGYTIVTTISKSEAFYSRDNITILYSFILVIVFAILFAVIYFLIKKLVVNNIKKINIDLAKIIDGNLDVVLNATGSNEFVSLSDDINTTVSTLKHYIDEAASRIDEELAFAKSIQASALPNVFPASKIFDLHAAMKTAKEVGGDFYDFFPVGSHHFMFLIADVSGKGIPAAMFMMRSKTLIKSLCETNELKLDAIISHVNNELCSDNDKRMFVTGWFGLLDLNSGELEFVNAGHNPPIIRRKGKKYVELQMKRNLVLAGMKDVPYTLQTIKLNKGDEILLYTDGVTEATNAKKELYGLNRLLNCANTIKYTSSKNLIENIMKSVDAFQRDVDQFDDITMLSIRYYPTVRKYHEEVTIDANTNEIAKAIAFIDKILSRFKISDSSLSRINIFINEVLSNVIRYSYENKGGKISILFDVDEKSSIITFVDNGKPYNMFKELEVSKKKKNLSEKDISALGMRYVKQMSHSISYRRIDKKNVTTIKRKFVE